MIADLDIFLTQTSKITSNKIRIIIIKIFIIDCII